MNETEQYLDDIINLHRDAQRQLREAITDLDSAALSWTPGAETSAIGTIITHALGADAEVLRNVLQIPTDRHRDAEFAVETHTPADLLRLLDACDDDWQQLAPRISAEQLLAARPRPNKPTPQSGLFWLVRNYGHLREHLAQIHLTRQLYQAGNQPPRS